MADGQELGWIMVAAHLKVKKTPLLLELNGNSFSHNLSLSSNIWNICVDIMYIYLQYACSAYHQL